MKTSRVIMDRIDWIVLDQFAPIFDGAGNQVASLTADASRANDICRIDQRQPVRLPRPLEEFREAAKWLVYSPGIATAVSQTTA